MYRCSSDRHGGPNRGLTATISPASGGSHPKPLHPAAVRVMGERGIDLSDRRSKHLKEFRGEHFDYVITLCDRVREVCPEFPGAPRTIHWSVREPGAASEFERTAVELEMRVGFLLAAINDEEVIAHA